MQMSFVKIVLAVFVALVLTLPVGAGFRMAVLVLDGPM